MFIQFYIIKWCAVSIFLFRLRWLHLFLHEFILDLSSFFFWKCDHKDAFLVSWFINMDIQNHKPIRTTIVYISTSKNLPHSHGSTSVKLWFIWKNHCLATVSHNFFKSHDYSFIATIQSLNNHGYFSSHDLATK